MGVGVLSLLRVPWGKMPRPKPSLSTFIEARMAERSAWPRSTGMPPSQVTKGRRNLLSKSSFLAMKYMRRRRGIREETNSGSSAEQWFRQSTKPPSAGRYSVPVTLRG